MTLNGVHHVIDRNPILGTREDHQSAPPGIAAISAVAVVTGLAVWFFASMIGDDGVNTGGMVGIFVASIGLTFFFPALQTYLAPRLV